MAFPKKVADRFRCVVAYVLLACPLASAESNFTFNESADKLTNKMNRSLAVTAEDGRSIIELRHTEGEPSLIVYVDPDKTIFPDNVNTSRGDMSVGVTLRSSVMKEPVSLNFAMNMMKYDFCYLKITPASARKLFSGAHVTVQLSRTADRMTFPTGGEGFAEALDKVVVPAEKLETANAEAEAAKRDEAAREALAAQNAEMQAERDAKEREEAMKPATDGRQAGEALAEKVGKKVSEFSVTGITARAKAAAKKAGYEGEQAEMFIKAFVEAVQKAKGK